MDQEEPLTVKSEPNQNQCQFAKDSCDNSTSVIGTGEDAAWEPVFYGSFLSQIESCHDPYDMGAPGAEGYSGMYSASYPPDPNFSAPYPSNSYLTIPAHDGSSCQYGHSNFPRLVRHLYEYY